MLVGNARRVRLSVWLRVDGAYDPRAGMVDVVVWQYSASGTNLTGQGLFPSSQPTLGSAWREFSREIDLVPGTTSIDLSLGYASTVSGDHNRIYFDDVSLTPIG